MSEHEVEWNRLSGAVFWTVLFTAGFYMAGFATHGWAVDRDSHVQYGLWDMCKCNWGSPDTAWFKASQAMMTLGLVALLVSMVFCCLYLVIQPLRKSITVISIIISQAAMSVFSFIGLVVFGAKHGSLDHDVSLSYSYGFLVIALCLCLTGCGLSIYHWKKNKS